MRGNMGETAAKKRIAILGGGIGSLTTAFWLTSEPGWQDRFEITLYQLGWRLGGKCACGRDPDRGYRIAEHGLHVWYGWYANAFRTLRAAYTELARPPGAPLATIDEAFVARPDVQIVEQWPPASGTWRAWNFDMPVHPGHAGTAEPEVRFWPTIVRLLETLTSVVDHWAERRRQRGIVGWLRRQLSRVELLGGLAEWALLEGALDQARQIGADRRHDTPDHHETIRTRLRGFLGWLHRELAAELDDPVVRHVLILADLGVAVVTGLLADRIHDRGLGSIDAEEFGAWLRRHGASQLLMDSALLQALYDAWFAYRDGVSDMEHRDIAAGVAVGCVIRMFLLYQGPLLHVMASGMGDAVIAPLYEVLVRRGVRFEFFCDVQKLGLTADGSRIARIEIARQADVTSGRYQPLIAVNSLPSWPTRPLYDQLVQGDELSARGVDLESHWSGWQPVGHTTLEAGRDFDDVVLGISLGGLRGICSELIEHSPAWKAMIERIPTIPTQSMQVWFDATLGELGWDGAPRPSVGVPEPLSVWSEMSHTLARESWPIGKLPRGIIYLCGPLDDRAVREPHGDPPAHARSVVRANAIQWFTRYAGWIWPASGDGASKAIDWSRMSAPDGVVGPDRIDAQILRANIDPSERYVLSPHGTTALRLDSARSGFANLVLAGDWTRTVISAGCVEAATVSGMAASRALCGAPARIWGEDFLAG